MILKRSSNKKRTTMMSLILRTRVMMNQTMKLRMVNQLMSIVKMETYVAIQGGEDALLGGDADLEGVEDLGGKADLRKMQAWEERHSFELMMRHKWKMRARILPNQLMKGIRKSWKAHSSSELCFSQSGGIEYVH
ncbi:hypothetical protein Scep_007463 [Stephania cephalantha]|uniref:Uncharacterized protein n=1 Tax=Stephania cephalantha TaxID=152367 RepID=A0AAP0PQ27_9MAGN